MATFPGVTWPQARDATAVTCDLIAIILSHQKVDARYLRPVECYSHSLLYGRRASRRAQVSSGCFSSLSCDRLNKYRTLLSSKAQFQSIE